MTSTLDPPILQEDDEPIVQTAEAPPQGGEPSEEAAEEAKVDVELRPLLVAFLATLGAGLTAGGIFGSWGARLLAVAAAAVGVGWAWFTLRSPRRMTRLVAFGPLLLVLASLTLLGTPKGPAGMGSEINSAIRAGRVLKPPIPFDPGWRPLLLIIVAFTAFVAAWVASAAERPTLGLAVPVPLLALTAITQPPNGQLLAGLMAVLPLVAALATLYGNDLRSGDDKKAPKLSKEFELQRALRSAGLVVAAIVVLVIASRTNFLFPQPAFDPDQQAQKPRSVPLSATEDKVLFEVEGPITGPWKFGHLDVYDKDAWKLPPIVTKKMRQIPPDGTLQERQGEQVEVTFTIRGLETSAIYPGLVDPIRTTVTEGDAIFDPRAGILRQRTGRVPVGISYTVARTAYPSAEQLRQAPPTGASGEAGVGYERSDLSVPEPPPSVSALLARAPSGSWDRLDFLLKEMNKVVIAVGEGVPVDVPPSTVERILVGNHEANPFEIVATQALLARWAGLPSRIGFGFDGVQEEDGKKTVRPMNAAQWLEVYIEGTGWVPVVVQPPRAKQQLDQNVTKTDPTILPSSDVAVEVLIPIKIVSVKQLYEKVRSIVFTALPFVLLAVAVYLGAPAVERYVRRNRRRRWAAGVSPEAQIAVEYVEMRDLATDLGVGEPYTTPIEFLDHLDEDPHHEELAWLVTRALYGDLDGRIAAEDVLAAEELAGSVKTRLRKGQPFQSRALAAMSRASLREPYSWDVPNTRKPPKPPKPKAVKRKRHRGRRRLPLVSRIPVLGRRFA